jgi:glycosyltransferase involved in cell wall biosynthesis
MSNLNPAPDISVAMITMNEEGAVALVIGEIRKVVPGAEILIVDSSKDQTAEIAQSLGARVIKQFPPRGYGRAMELALRSSAGKVVVTLDCDNTYPADIIPELADKVLNGGIDIIDASRLERKPQAMPWINYLANVGFALMASVLFVRHLTDLHSGMRAYRKSMIDELKFDASGPALPVDLLLIPIKLGYKVDNRFIPYRDRIGVSTMNPLPSAWWTLKRILSTRFISRDQLRASTT